MITVEENIEAIGIRVGEDGARCYQQRPNEIRFHAQSSLLFAKHQIEGMFDSRNNFQSYDDRKNPFLDPLIFNIDQWTNYENIELSKSTQRNLANRKIGNELSVYEINGKFNSERATYNAVNIYSYFYLKTKSIPNAKQFLIMVFDDFIDLIDYQSSIDDEEKKALPTWIKPFRDAKSFSELKQQRRLLHASRDEKPQLVENVVVLVDLVMDVYKLIFEQFKSKQKVTPYLKDSPILDNNSITSELNRIVPHVKWSLNTAKQIAWTTLSNENNANLMIQYFKDNQYHAIEKKYNEHTKTWVIMLERPKSQDLQKIPVNQLTWGFSASPIQH